MTEADTAPAEDEADLPPLRLRPRSHQPPPFISTQGVAFYAREKEGQWHKLNPGNVWVSIDEEPT